MTPDPILPHDPLGRFCEVYAALNERRGWFESASTFRYAALALALAPGSPTHVAAELRRTAEALKARAGWFGPLNSPVRFVVAAQLVAHGDDPDAFADEVERCTRAFKARGLSRSGIYPAVAVLILFTGHDGGRRSTIPTELLDRVAALWKAMKRHHAFLTGTDDLPACALLALHAGGVDETSGRVENLYRGLRDHGYGGGNPLQFTSHLLALVEQPVTTLLARFHALYEQFKGEDLWMHRGDYDDVALLCFAGDPPAEVAAAVLRHRPAIEALKPRPAKDTSFSLACGTALLELLGGADPKAGAAATITAVHAVIAMANAAVAAVAVSAASAAAASG